MVRTWYKRAAAYVVLTFLVVGVLLTLRNAAVKVELVVDLAGARTVAEAPLQEVRCGVFDGEEWVSGSVYSFPAGLYPDGPPSETHPVTLELPPGSYRVVLDLNYDDKGTQRLLQRTVNMVVEEASTVRIKAVH